MKNILLLLPALCVACSPVRAPRSGSDVAEARLVVVEITDTAPGGVAKTSSVPLSLVEEKGASVFEISTRSEKLKIEAVADRKGPSPFVRVKVYRWRTNDARDQSSEIAFSEQTLWKPGERTMLGRTNTPEDGAATEISFTMK